VARLYMIASTNRRGRFEEVVQVESARRARRLFDVACAYGTPFPGPKRRRRKGRKTITLSVGRETAPRTYGVGYEPEQAASGFRIERRLAICHLRR
jgi:hypothetical protein